VILSPFGALMLLAGKQEGHPVWKKLGAGLFVGGISTAALYVL